MSPHSDRRSTTGSLESIPQQRNAGAAAHGIGRSNDYNFIRDSVSFCLQHYGLLDVQSERAIVALSGGKDSLLLARCLADLGADVLPIAIDMGYEQGWSDKISALSRTIGLVPQIIDVRTQIRRRTAVDLQISRRIEILDSISATRGPGEVTPCTHCYSVKVLALDSAAQREGITKVAFAHHMTDAIASLVKEGIMHLDRHRFGHEQYMRYNFERLVDALKAESRKPLDSSSKNSLTEALATLVASSLLDTDEPPRQPLRSDGSQCEIIRPLFLVDESHIKRVVADTDLETAGSGCGHDATIDTQTPRELVHFQLLEALGETFYYQILRELVLRGIAEDGTGKVRARQRRSALIGHRYKPPADDLDKL